MSRADALGFAPQPNLETAAATVVFSPPVTSEDISIDREDLEIDETLGTRAPGPQEYGGRIFGGTIEGALRPRSGGLILSGFWGNPTSTQPDVAGAPTVFEHVWDPIVNLPIFTSIWTKNADVTPAIIDKYVGAVGNELGLSVEANDYMLFEAEYLARLLDITAPDPPMSRDTSGKWPFHKVTAEIGYGAGVYQSVALREFGMSYNNNLEDDQFILGSVNVDSIPLGDIEFEVTIRPTRDIEAHYRRSLADTPEDVKIKLVAEGPVIITVGAVSYRHRFELEIHRLQTVEAPVDIDGGETLRDVEVTLRGVLDDATNKLLTAKLTNDYSGVGYRAPAA